MNTKEEAKFAREIVRSLLIGAFEQGEVTEQEIKDGSAMKKLKRHAAKAAKTNDDSAYRFILDHTLTLLKDAKKNLDEKKYDNAGLFYSIYFEHEANRLLSIKLGHIKFNEENAKKIMRQPLYDKLTWIADLIGIKRPHKNFLNFIKPLSDERNAFVHYKWTEIKDWGDSDSKRILAEVNKNVRYFKSYVSRQIYGGRKKIIIQEIDNLLKKSKKS